MTDLHFYLKANKNKHRLQLSVIAFHYLQLDRRAILKMSGLVPRHDHRCWSSVTICQVNWRLSLHVIQLITLAWLILPQSSRLSTIQSITNGHQQRTRLQEPCWAYCHLSLEALEICRSASSPVGWQHHQNPGRSERHLWFVECW